MVGKLELGKLCIEHKEKYDAAVEEAKNKVNYCNQRKKHVNKKTNTGYLASALREFYPDLKNLKHDDRDFVRALKMAKCVYETAINRSSLDPPPLKKICRALCGGRKSTAPDVRLAL